MPASRATEYGLLGRTLGHSWSPQIHAALGSTPYELIELEPDEVVPFVREGSWRGLNVTIPYKRTAAEAADVLSPRVEALGVANTLVHRADGGILADNTDVLGFEAMVSSFAQRTLKRDAREAFGGRRALVLGTGGAAQAVTFALRESFGCDVMAVSRTGDTNYQNLVERGGDAALVVNTTPVGMYPSCPASPLAEGTLERLPNLAAVLDVVYNPTRTGICQQAERLGIPSESGLSMLVWQALFASELFQGTDLDHGLVDQILESIHRQTTNVVLIGMPGAGKTTAGRALARLTHRPFIDLDDAFNVEAGVSPSEFITTQGEEAFRRQETEVLKGYAARTGLVIACGGGVVTRPENYAPLHQNGTIVFLDRPLKELSSRGRPLSQAKGVEQLAKERMGLYRSWADLTVSCTGSPSSDAAFIRAELGI
ncbi:MAG: shikimate kinase [Atopobiaceae bacterium]|nr:shikimate kinase [Atopobiaceae bacterium]